MYTRLPAGIFSSPGNLLAEITYVIVKLDDILVSDKNDEEHLRNLEEVLKQLSKEGLNLKKYIFMVPELVYCGFEVRVEGVTSLKANVRVICEARISQNTSRFKS